MPDRAGRVAELVLVAYPTGPWDEELTVVTGADLTFTMSLFEPYNVTLMRTSLADVAPTAAGPECVALEAS